MPLSAKSKTQQEVCYFEFSLHFVPFLPFSGIVFKRTTLSDLNRSTSNFVCEPFAMLNCKDLEFLSKGVSVVAWHALMFWNERGSYCNSAIQCRICHKRHAFNKSPGLNTFPYSFIVIAPPTGNRKFMSYTNSNIPCSICTKINYLICLIWFK